MPAIVTAGWLLESLYNISPVLFIRR